MDYTGVRLSKGLEYLKKYLDEEYGGNAASLAREIEETEASMSRAIRGKSKKALERILRKIGRENPPQNVGVESTSQLIQTGNPDMHQNITLVLADLIEPLIRKVLMNSPALQETGIDNVFTFTFPIQVGEKIYDVRVKADVMRRLIEEGKRREKS